MNNAQAPSFVTVELTLFGTLFTEAQPEALPNGASPLSVNCDYDVGSVTQRPGLYSFFVFEGLDVESFAHSGTNVPGSHAPNEEPWDSPNNISLATLGTYASVSLNAPLGTNFLGKSVYVSTTNSFLFNYGVAQSVSFEFSTTTTLGGTFLQANVAQLAPFRVAGPSGDTVPYFAIYMLPNGTLEAEFFNTSSNILSGATPLSYNDGNTHTCFVTFNSGVIKIYIDGANVLTFSGVHGSGTHAVYWIIAWAANFLTGFTTVAQFLTSFMTNVAVWGDAVITPTEISNVETGAITLASLDPDSLWLLTDAGSTAVDQQGTNPGTYRIYTPVSLFQNNNDLAYTGETQINLVIQFPSTDEAEWSMTANSGIQEINVGDSIIVQIQYDQIFTGGPYQGYVSAATDNFGNTYTQLGPLAAYEDTGGGRPITLQFYWCQAAQAIPKNSAMTWTVFTHSGTIDSAGAFDQFLVCSVPSLIALDQSGWGGGAIPGSGFFTTIPALTIPAAELLLSLVGTYNTAELMDPVFIFLYGDSGGNAAETVMYQPQVGGTYSATFEGAASSQYGTLNVSLTIAAGRSVPTGDLMYSEILRGVNFNFGALVNPDQNILGIQIVINGHQTSLDENCFLTVNLYNTDSDVVVTTQLPLSDGSVTLGTITDDWDITPPPTQPLIASPNFGVDIFASATDGTNVTFAIYEVAIILWLTASPPQSFNYLKTFEQTDGEILNLVLGSDGVFYQEDIVNNPGILVAANPNILPDQFAESCTVDDREFIAISNLQNGTDLPYTYTPPVFSRLTQVGPGTAPVAASTSSGSAIANIHQQAAVVIPSSTGGTSGTYVTLSAGQTGLNQPKTPGNILTFSFPHAFVMPTYLMVGDNVVISGIQDLNGMNVNNAGAPVNPNPSNPTYYTVISIGQPIAGQAYYDGFAVTVMQNGFYGDRVTTAPTATFQATLATLTAVTQVPNLQVGDQLEITGTGGAPTSGYDGTWTVENTPNASQLDITATELLNNVMIYSYSLVTGTAPVVNQAVTVQQTVNGNGIFNVIKGIIASTGSGTFSINLVHANIGSSFETGSAVVLGTIFQFDPMVIVGNKGGGTIVSVGIIGQGQRQVCYCFQTETGALTQPSPIFIFQVPSGASAITVSNLLAGPPNVVARVICFTAADGGNFYYIAIPVNVVDNGVTVVNSATVVNDNTTQSVTLSFSDSVLLTGIQIDTQGNNLFECAELGSLTMLIPYSQRLVAIGEQNKVTNLINWSFDGGVQVTSGNTGGGSGSGATQSTYPAGWTPDPTFFTGGSIVVSQRFGWSYQIQNISGSTQSIWGLISQTAYQDTFGVDIIDPSTLYSARITASMDNIGGAPGGVLALQFWSPALQKEFGQFTIPFSSMTDDLVIYTGAMNAAGFAPVPPDLELHLFASDITNGITCTIDRIEVFPTLVPNLSGQVTLSYQGAFEQFDQISGVITTSVQNQQACVSGFTLFDSLYLVKTGSFISTKDNQQTEPSFWPVPKTISNSVGTPSVYGVTTGIDQANTGEEWALVAGYAGCYIFNGGEPVKLSEEIQQLWDFINWKYGYLLWIVNDILNRRILIGVPMNTSKTVGSKTFVNPWVPTTVIPATSNASYVNCVLELNYKQLNTAGLLQEKIGVRTSYSAKLIASEITRKWSVWSVQAPCAAFLRRPDGSNPVFLGNSADTGKVYEMVDQLFEDDGNAIWQMYQTFGFVQGEAGQGLQMGMVRYNYDYMTLIMDGNGAITITVYPSNLTTSYSHTLLPDLVLPLQVNGDIEVPVNECGSRLFFMFSCDAVGSGFTLTRMVVAMHQDPWSPVRGGNY